MSPIEVFIDGKFHARTDTGPSEIALPKPPGGNVEWYGDGAGSGQMIAGLNNQCEVFELTEEGQEATYKVPSHLSAALFKEAVNGKTEIVIKRV